MKQGRGVAKVFEPATVANFLADAVSKEVRIYRWTSRLNDAIRASKIAKEWLRSNNDSGCSAELQLVIQNLGRARQQYIQSKPSESLSFLESGMIQLHAAINLWPAQTEEGGSADSRWVYNSLQRSLGELLTFYDYLTVATSK